MRSVVIACLLLLLPSLLLPAGLLLHVCRCDVPMQRAAGHSCCADDDAVDAGAPSCCGGERDPDAPPSIAADDCECTWVALTDDQPEPTRPEPPLIALPAGSAIAPASWQLPNTSRELAVVHAARSRPPPDQQRSLPLRL
ncbi:MAG: hypothetical protein MUC36_18355 [Planctomycetes bacterium]|jgi:hypothetical protein|nr:hypothetical protein [Planctomycetota bacterium]